MATGEPAGVGHELMANGAGVLLLGSFRRTLVPVERFQLAGDADGDSEAIWDKGAGINEGRDTTRDLKMVGS